MRVKLVVLDKPPLLAVTVIVLVPAGVEAEVEMVRVLVQVRLQDVGKESVAPAGRPDTKKDTNLPAVPDIWVAVTVLVTEEPWITDLSPPMESPKSNGSVGGAVDLQVTGGPQFTRNPDGQTLLCPSLQVVRVLQSN